MALMLLWLIRKALTREITKPNNREYSATLKFSSSPDALATPMIVSTKPIRTNMTGTNGSSMERNTAKGLSDAILSNEENAIMVKTAVTAESTEPISDKNCAIQMILTPFCAFGYVI